MRALVAFVMLVAPPAAAAEVAFEAEHLYWEAPRPEILGAVSADLDGDGDEDIAHASWNADLVVITTAGEPPGTVGVSTTFPVEDPIAWRGITGAEVRAGDLDGDGDLDLVAIVEGYRCIDPWCHYGTIYSTRLDLWENLGALGGPTPWRDHPVAREGGWSRHSLTLVDMDEDGDLDLVSGLAAADVAAGWRENPGALDAPWVHHPLFDAVPTQLAAFDADGDGDTDLLSAAPRGGEDVALHLRDGEAWVDQPLPFVPIGSRPVVVADMDDDGDDDLLTAEWLGEPVVAWYEQDEGAWPRHEAFSSPGWAVDSPFAPLDMDGDGDLDVVLSDATGVFWMENAAAGWVERDALPRFVAAEEFSFGDLDGDGSPELRATFGYRRLHARIAEPGGWAPSVLAATGYARWWQATSTDLDGDGTPELLLSDAPDFMYAPGPRSAGPAHHLPAFGRALALPGDVDGDGAVDIVRVSDDEATWWSRDVGPLGAETWLPHELPDLTGPVAVADMDGDGDADLVSFVPVGDDGDGGLSLFVNDGASWTRATLDAEFVEGSALKAVDLDADGDLDIFAQASRWAAFRWYENGDWSVHETGVTGGAATLADLDGDGLVDLVQRDRPSLRWFRNPGPETTAWPSGGEIPVFHGGSHRERAADVDHDGDVDLVGIDGRDIVWWDNEGAGTDWTMRTLVTVEPGGAAVDVAAVDDLDADGDVDIAFQRVGEGLLWLEQPGSLLGDDDDSAPADDDDSATDDDDSTPGGGDDDDSTAGDEGCACAAAGVAAPAWPLLLLLTARRRRPRRPPA